MNTRLKLLCESKNNTAVVFDPLYSHAATHFADNPELEDLVVEVVRNLELNGQEFAGHVDMGRIVGVSDVISVNDGDEIVYAVRRNRDADGLVPFVKNREGDPCPYVAVHLVPLHDDACLLSSAWIGTFGGDDEPFPLAPDATPLSKEYWDTHAFVYGSQGAIPGTETSKKPW